jgi:hypothetical protein
MDLKLIITDALQFFRYHMVQIAALCLPWLLAVALVEYLVIITGNPSPEASPLPLIGGAVHMLVYPIYTGALILLMAKRARRETPANKELLLSAVKLWQPLFILRMMMMVGILVPGVIFLSQGWSLFIVPIIYVAVRLSFAEFYLVLEKANPLEAIRLSFKATQPCFFQILFLWAIFIFPLMSLQFVAAIVLARPGIDPLVNALAATAIAFFSLFVDVLLFRAYMSATQEHPQ